jgi:hypothetical protein
VNAITRGAGSWFLTAYVCVSIRAVRLGILSDKMAPGWVVFIFIHLSCGACTGDSLMAAVPPSLKTRPNKTYKQADFFFLLEVASSVTHCTDGYITVFCDTVNQNLSLLLCSIIRGSKKAEI